MEYTKKLCSCGNPQSYPIPHEHDQTEREQQIIKYYKGINTDLYEALRAMPQPYFQKDSAGNEFMALPYAEYARWDAGVRLIALAKAEGK